MVCFLLHSILFFISQTSYRTYKIISSYELARPIMGTIFLVRMSVYARIIKISVYARIIRINVSWCCVCLVLVVLVLRVFSAGSPGVACV